MFQMPMSSPMMKRMFGLPWAAATPVDASTTARVKTIITVTLRLPPYIMSVASCRIGRGSQHASRLEFRRCASRRGSCGELALGPDGVALVPRPAARTEFPGRKMRHPPGQPGAAPRSLQVFTLHDAGGALGPGDVVHGGRQHQLAAGRPPDDGPRGADQRDRVPPLA